MDPFRDDENEDRMQQIIYASARGTDAGGKDSGGEDDDFSSQFLNDSGERLESKERRDEVPLTNSGEVYILRLC